MAAMYRKNSESIRVALLSLRHHRATVATPATAVRGWPLSNPFLKDTVPGTPLPSTMLHCSVVISQSKILVHPASHPRQPLPPAETARPKH
jgi:hypothetical protein